MTGLFNGQVGSTKFSLIFCPLKWLAEMTCADLETGRGPEGR